MDQEMAQADDPPQMAPALPVVPSDPAVKRYGAERGGGKPDHAEPALCRADEVADLATCEGRRPVGVLRRDQRVRHRLVSTVPDHDNLKIPSLRGMRRNLLRRRDITRQQLRPTAADSVTARTISGCRSAIAVSAFR